MQPCALMSCETLRHIIWKNLSWQTPKPNKEPAVTGIGHFPLWTHRLYRTWNLSCFVMFAREGNTPDHHMTITYHQLLRQVCRCANVLKQMGETLMSPLALIKEKMNTHYVLGLFEDLCFLMDTCIGLWFTHESNNEDHLSGFDTTALRVYTCNVK